MIITLTLFYRRLSNVAIIANSGNEQVTGTKGTIEFISKPDDWFVLGRRDLSEVGQKLERFGLDVDEL